MQISLFVKDLVAGAPLRAYLDKKVKKLERLCRAAGDVVASIELDHTRPARKGQMYRAEANLSCRGWGKTFRAQEYAASPEAAMDLVEEEIERQIIKFKEKAKRR